MNLRIADFTIKITSDKPIQLEEGYLAFMDEKEYDHPNITVECISGLPEDLLRVDELLFEAKNDEQQFYSIFKNGKGLTFFIYDQKGVNVIQQIATLDETLSHWKIYYDQKENKDFNPLKYPMGPLLMYYLTVKEDAVMMHASGAFDGQTGRIFIGFSGAGKSTISSLFKESGQQLINDDRLIIRKQGAVFYMYNTPMYYYDESKKAPLNSIHLIRHALENTTQKITGAKAVSNVLAFCIQNNYDKQFIENHLKFIYELCATAGVYETGFIPDVRIVDYLETNEDGKRHTS